MPTSKYFGQCPPFPSDMPVACLSRVSLKQLQDQCPDEAKKLFDACQDWGFFLLDLTHSTDGETLLHDAESMYELTAETFALEQDILDKYAYNPSRDLTGCGPLQPLVLHRAH